MSRYDYTDQEWGEIEHMIHLAIPRRIRLRKTQLEEDRRGVDVYYEIDGRCPLAIRVRKDRPAFAADSDVTLRHTEPVKIARGTYAPLEIFVWLVGGWAKAGKLVDIYRLAAQLDPPLEWRATRANPNLIPNGDGTWFFPIDVAELWTTKSLLRQGDRDEWAAACLGGNERTLRIIDSWELST